MWHSYDLNLVKCQNLYKKKKIKIIAMAKAILSKKEIIGKLSDKRKIEWEMKKNS